MKQVNIRKTIFSLVLLSFISSYSFSQEKEVIKPIRYYLGIQPSVNIEPFDEYRNSVDINTLPLIFEYAIDRNWSLRLTPVLNLQIRPEFPAAFSRLGLGLTVPYHFSKKNSEEGHRGFYVGPHIAGIYHKLDEFNSVTLAGELGYAFLFNGVLSIHVGAQAGTTIMLNPASGYNLLVRHVGGIFSFGFWF